MVFSPSRNLMDLLGLARLTLTKLQTLTRLHFSVAILSQLFLTAHLVLALLELPASACSGVLSTPAALAL
jgi:thiosulfate reductase cytochrome b subunit